VVELVIFAEGLGGAEKRFIGLWLHLRRRGVPIGLVLGKALLAKLHGVREFDGLPTHASAITTFDSAQGLADLRRVLRQRWLRDRRTVFHFVHVPPIVVQRFPSRRTVFSMTAATWRYTSRRGLLATYAGMIAAGHVDVLNEPVWAGLQRSLFWRRSSITLTPNSFVDLDVYRPAPFADKRDRLTFVGLFSRDKGIFRLVELLPQLDRRLRARGLAPEYRLLGRDVEHPGISEACARLRPGIDVEVFEDPNPMTILAASKVFFSLQQTTNYPSKSLLEAFACGALPIVTDVPDSRRIAPDELGFYVPREFSAEHLAARASEILELDKARFAARVDAGRAHVGAHFSVETMASYYLDVYKEMGAAVR
jgi:glycosyltransferase involved in cell wall biosynthesis